MWFPSLFSIHSCVFNYWLVFVHSALAFATATKTNESDISMWRSDGLFSRYHFHRSKKWLFLLEPIAIRAIASRSVLLFLHDFGATWEIPVLGLKNVGINELGKAFSAKITVLRPIVRKRTDNFGGKAGKWHAANWAKSKIKFIWLIIYTKKN